MKFHPVLAPLCLLFTACTPDAAEVTIDSSEIISPSGQTSGPESPDRDALVWSFDYQGRDNSPRLSYSGLETDETAIIFECRVQEKVTVRLDRVILGRMPPDWPFTLTSGDVQAQLKGRLARIAPNHFLVEAQAPVSAPIFAAIRDNGEASIDDSSRLAPMPLTAIDDSEREAIVDFLSACQPA